MTWWVYIPRRNGDHHRWASVTASRASVQNAPVYHHCFEPDSDRILIGKWRAGRRPLDGSHVPALISDFSTSPVSAANDSFVNTQPVHGGLNVLIPCRYYSTATSTFSTTTIKRVLCNFPLSAKQTNKKRFLFGLLFRAWKVCRRKLQGKNKLDRLVYCFWHSSWEFTPGNGPGGLWPTATYIRCHDLSVSLGLWIIQRAWFLITQSLSPRPEK